MTAIDAWRCPTCGRAVPRLVDVCRCGHQRTGGEAAATLGAGPTPTPAPAIATGMPAADAVSPRRPPTVLLMMVALLAGVVLAYVFLRPAARPSALGKAETPSAAPDDTHAAPLVSSETEATPQWPNDPTLFKQATKGNTVSVPSPASVVATGFEPAASSVEDIVSGAIPAVVLVETVDGRGTGFYVASDTVVTNAHVVEGATYVTLRSATGEQTSAMVTTRSPELDLAVVHVAKAKAGQPILPLGSSGDVRVGQEIVAIGSPLGLQNTVTRGIVSSLRRAGQVTLVQTDAAINPGNSGGPLLDRRGRVVAVATMKLTGQAESLGFGVAAEHVRAILDGNAPASTGRRIVDTMNGSSASDPDAERNDATEGYERFIAEAAKKADQLDRSWATLVGECLSGHGPTTRGDREWFAIWESFDDARVSAGCNDYYGDLKGAALAFRRRISEASDVARRAGVYPGRARDIRRQYRLDSPDW